MYNQVWYNLINVTAMGVHFELDKYIKYHWLNIGIGDIQMYQLADDSASTGLYR